MSDQTVTVPEKPPAVQPATQEKPIPANQGPPYRVGNMLLDASGQEINKAPIVPVDPRGA